MNRLRVRAHSIARLGDLAVGVITVPAAALTAYIGLLTAVGLRQPYSSPRGRCDTRFAIFVPAHDEEAGIAATLETFHALAYPRERFSVHVVADNCSDGTADVVRTHGFEVHERVAPEQPGKGPALNWLRDRLAARGDPYDVAVVVDADTSLDPDFLAALDRVFARGVAAAQGFYSVRDPEASTAASFRYAALACRHHLRSMGRTRLGGSCGLFGNGMAFQRDVLEQRAWSGHLVEDHEFQLKLLLDGVDVAYVPDAHLRAEMPSTLDQAESQNRRWERGRAELVRRFLPRLVAGAARDGRRVAHADAAVDLLVPPLSVLVGVHLVLGAVAAPRALLGGRLARRLLAVNAGAVVALIVHAVAGLASIRASTRHRRALLAAPYHVMWKVSVWLSALTSDEVPWTRTERNVMR